MPGIVSRRHHMGRWRLKEQGMARWSSALVDLVQVKAGQWAMSQRQGITPWPSEDPDSMRVWWTDAGVHQNLTFPVHPDPVSGMHCWHQKVTVARAEAGDHYGNIFVDTNRSAQVYREWLALAHPADQVSPDGNRRPYWLLRPFRPTAEAYRLPGG